MSLERPDGQNVNMQRTEQISKNTPPPKKKKEEEEEEEEEEGR